MAAVIGSHWLSQLAPAEQPPLRERWQRWQASGEDCFEADPLYCMADGSQLPVHLTLQRSRNGFRAYLTPQLKAQQLSKHLQQLESRLDALFRTGNQSIAILDLNHRILEFNHTAAEISWLRFHREMTKGECFTNYVQPDRMDDFYESFQQVLQGRHVFKERVIYAPDRQGYTYEMTYTPIYDQNGRIDSVCFMMVNVEHQRQIRLLLNHEQSFVTSILNATNSLIVVLDKQGQIVRFNKACERITGYSYDQVRDQVFWDLLVMPEERERVRQLYQQIGARSQLNNVQYRLRDRQGTGHFISWSLSVMQGLKEDTLYIVSTGIDVTDRVAAEQALQESEAMLRQAQKMEAVGHLAGGIAHDFNNMLTAIMGYGQLLEGTVPPDSDSREYLDEILRMCTKARELTHQLLMFSRKAPADSHPVNVSQVLTQMEGLFRQLLEDKVQMLLVLEPNPGWIQANPLHLEQVMMNLVVNARDAIGPEGGVLKIAARRQYLAEDIHHPMFGAFAAGDYVCLSVADTGCGMSAETRRCIFEPFFTTKERGKGTGLGLAVVYRIVREFGGWVDVSSLPGQGSTFELFFPILPAQPPVTAAQCQLVLYKLPAEQQQTIRNSLQDFACDIESASQPEQLQQLFDRDEPPKLLITHLNQPRPNGYAVLMHRFPSLKVLYLAGDSQEEMAQLDQLGLQEDVLLAPFTPHQLRIRIQRMMGR
ncbi:MAG: PAS domain S-box protein [Candidatus Sericytochromatia bacterium]